MPTASTSERILDIAEGLVQTRGYQAFSFADIADSLGIRKASIHYHYPSKAELARAVAERYRRAFGERLEGLDREFADPTQRLMRYVRLFQEGLQDGEHMCLYGMLASDTATIPEPVLDAVHGFFDDQERWLARVLSQGRVAGQFRFEGPAEGAAEALLAGLEGAMLVARCRRDVSRFAAVALRLVGAVTG